MKTIVSRVFAILAYRVLAIIICIFLLCANLKAQLYAPDIGNVGAVYEKYADELNRRTKCALKYLLKAEQKVHGADAAGVRLLYDSLLKNAATVAPQQWAEYSSALDSVKTTLGYLMANAAAANGQLPGSRLPAAQQSMNRLLSSMNYSVAVDRFLAERAVAMGIPGISQKVYYYRQQLRAYRELIKHPEKLQHRLLEVMRNIPAFQEYFLKNSYLASQFGAVNDAAGSAITGLQSRSEVADAINARLGNELADAAGSPLQNRLQSVMGEVNQVKDKVAALGGESSDMPMPVFASNNMRTKSFLQRLELGFNIQSQRNALLLPATTDMAVTAGYKISEKHIAGVGAAYKLGWGQPFNSIRFTHEGVGLRSWLDWKLKGSLWITGGFEYNYLQSFAKLSELHQTDSWQQSGLLGITKKWKVGKKQTHTQVLWDFLSYYQVPRSTALKFRVGYTLF